jgi:hypothetical protein
MFPLSLKTGAPLIISILNVVIAMIDDFGLFELNI